MNDRTYLLFIFGMFEDHEDIEFFCTEILTQSKVIKTIRFVIENSQNIIVIFESDLDQKSLSQELFGILLTDNIKFYFIFDRHSLVTAHLPKQVKDFIFRPATAEDKEKSEIIKVDYSRETYSPILDLDGLLEKIEKMGIESLTPEEKDFLDNFEE